MKLQQAANGLKNLETISLFVIFYKGEGCFEECLETL